MLVRKYLIGIFSLMLFVSGGAMAFLMVDENQDLSSRAGGWVVGKVSPLEVPKYDSGERSLMSGWEVSGKRVKINYLASLWQETDKEVLVSGDKKVTVRLVNGVLSTSEILKKYFSNDKQVRVLGKLEGERARESFVYSFYGQESVVDVWSLFEGKVKVLSVMSKESDRVMVEELLSKVELVDAKVKGVASEVRDDEVKVVTLSRPSVVMIATNFCSKVSVSRKEGLINSGGKDYPFCLAATGSGFFVDSGGYIATNGHVVQIDSKEAFGYGVVNGALDDLLADILTDLVRATQGVEVGREEMKKEIVEIHKNKEDLYQLLAIMDKMDSEGFFQVDKGNYKYLIQLAKTPIKFSKENKISLGQGIVEAKFIDANYGSYDEEKGFNGSDVALLKVDGGVVYPALPLGDTEGLDSGESLQVIGYPGIASGANSVLLDTSASVEPTVTRGVVSAIKEAKGDKRKLIQTDASITNGNSGGPAIDSKGKVIGIATYGLLNESSGGNYNFLRDINDLKELLEKNGIKVKTGETYDSWKLGLESYWLSYFKYSRDDFEKVAKVYPEHVSVARYLNDSKEKAGSIEDKTPKFTRGQRKLYMNISVGMMAVSVLGIVFMVVWGLVDKRKGRGGEGGQTNFQAVKPINVIPGGNVGQLPIPPSPPILVG
jgi:hypothetical protein